MSKVIFSDNSEVEVNDVSSIYAITLDTVDPDEIEAFKAKLTVKNLSSFKIMNPNPEMCSEGVDFKFIGCEPRNMSGESEEPTSTTFSCRPMTEIEKNIINLTKGTASNSEAIEEMAPIVAEGASNTEAIEELAALVASLM